jgi:hypothetical protein
MNNLDDLKEQIQKDIRCYCKQGVLFWIYIDGLCDIVEKNIIKFGESVHISGTSSHARKEEK